MAPAGKQKKKWSKGKVKDKAQHAVVLEKQTAERLNKDVQSYRLITVATLVDRLKINGSLARKALADLEEKGQIKKVVGHSKMNIYSTPRRYRRVNASRYEFSLAVLMIPLLRTISLKFEFGWANDVCGSINQFHLE
ncbi:S25 ribosomal protein-domain-containing protein [Aspergillus germanicus]